MLYGLLLIASITLAVGIANDNATVPQILITCFVAIILFSISIVIACRSYEKHVDCFRLNFIRRDGYHKIVYAYTYAGRARAIKDYKNLGYTLYSEAVVEKEDE